MAARRGTVPAMAPRRPLGNVRARGPGVWQITADDGVDPRTGARRRRYLTVHGSRRDAERALVQLTSDLRARRIAPGGGLTFADVLDAWWKAMAAHRWQDATAIRHRQDITVHLAELGRRRLIDLEPADLDRLYAAMTAAGAAARTVQHVHGTARAALNYAMRQGLIARNPATAAVVPVRRRTSRALPTAAQLDAVLDLAAGDGPVWHAWMLTAFRTGARPAELCALRWRDVDLDRAEITFAEALGRTLAGGYARKGTKTHSDRRTGVRVVAIDLATSAALRRLRAVLAERVLAAGHRLDGRYVVFPRDPLGVEPMNPDAPSKRWRRYAAAVNRAALAADPDAALIDPAVRLYDASRHYHASWALAAGFSPAEVAGRLGNSAEVVLRNYAHVLDGRSRAIADALDQQHTAGRPAR